MSDQNIEVKYLADYLVLIDLHYLASEIPPEQDDELAKEFYKKLPRNTGMAKLFIEKTTTEVGAGLDTVDRTVYRIKTLLAEVRQAIRIATSYGPNDYDYRIDSRDKEITNSSSSSSSSSLPIYFVLLILFQ